MTVPLPGGLLGEIVTVDDLVQTVRVQPIARRVDRRILNHPIHEFQVPHQIVAVLFIVIGTTLVAFRALVGMHSHHQPAELGHGPEQPHVAVVEQIEDAIDVVGGARSPGAERTIPFQLAPIVLVHRRKELVCVDRDIHRNTLKRVASQTHPRDGAEVVGLKLAILNKAFEDIHPHAAVMHGPAMPWRGAGTDIRILLPPL